MIGTISKEIGMILAMQNIKPSERVIVLTPAIYDKTFVDVWLGGLNRIEADYVHMIPYKVKNSNLSPLDADMLKSADVVINISPVPEPVPHLYSPYIPQLYGILESDTRWLDYMLSNHAYNIPRLMPSDAMINRTQRGAEIMEKAETIRVTSDAGTDITLSKKGRKGGKENGVVTHPSEWDNWGFGVVASSVIEESTEGPLVIDKGDYILGLYKGVTEPIKITFKDGSCEGRVEGGGLTGEVLRQSLKAVKDPDAYLVSHIGWGCHENAVWYGNENFCMADAESYMGNMQIALGKNFCDMPYRFSGLGGKNHCDYHCDIELLNCNFYLDGEVIVEKGKIVHPECR